VIDWLRSASADPQIVLDGKALPIAIRRHPTARRMILRLAADASEVRVTMPRHGTARDAIAFAESRRDWLQGQMERAEPRFCPLAQGALSYRGQTLRIEWDRAFPRKPELVDGAVRLGGPQDTRLKRLQRWLEGKALDLMRADLAYYCERARTAPVPELRLSRAQRRWGSCSSKGTVRVNWRLVQAPDHVRRSVVAHEVAHLTHFDHSPAFHALLAQIYGPELDAADRWLKNDGRSLYAAFG